MLNVYSNEYKRDNIIDFVTYFDKSKYTTIELLDGTNNQYREKINKFLDSLSKNTAPKFSKQIRTGMLSLLLTLMKEIKSVESGKTELLVFGYSIKNEVRMSSYVQEEICKLVHETSRYHDTDEELSVLRWLHDNKYIDVTLCMLTDTKKLKLDPDNTQIKPTQKIVDIIAGTNK